MKYKLIGYYSQDGYKLLGEDGKIYKSQNIVFEEGSRHCTLFDQQALQDESIFTEETSYISDTPTTSSTPEHHLITSDHNHNQTIHTDSRGAEDSSLTSHQGLPLIHEPYPIAPRHRHPTNNMPDRQTSRGVTDSSAAPPLQPAAPVQGLQCLAHNIRPTQVIVQSRESEQRIEEARETGEEWAEEEHHASVVFASPGYDMDLDAQEFHDYHLASFQSDLSEYVALLAESDEDNTYVPKSYSNAMKHSDVWFPPMEQEMVVMDHQGVFTKVECPEDRKVVGLKWIYRLKYNAEGEVVQKKACLVAQGFNQIPGVDFDQTYASVAWLESM